MENKAYLQAKGEFWNCIRMAPFTLCTSLIFAFGEWLPKFFIMLPALLDSVINKDIF